MFLPGSLPAGDATRPLACLPARSKPQELVHVEAAAAAGVPLIKRFTGGGTVVVDRWAEALLGAARLPYATGNLAPLLHACLLP